MFIYFSCLFSSSLFTKSFRFIVSSLSARLCVCFGLVFCFLFQSFIIFVSSVWYFSVSLCLLVCLILYFLKAFTFLCCMPVFPSYSTKWFFLLFVFVFFCGQQVDLECTRFVFRKTVSFPVQGTLLYYYYTAYGKSSPASSGFKTALTPEVLNWNCLCVNSISV